VNAGLPAIRPPLTGSGYIVEIGATRTECDVEQAIELIEGALAAYPIAPFVGSAADLTIAPLDAELMKDRLLAPRTYSETRGGVQR